MAALMQFDPYNKFRNAFEGWRSKDKRRQAEDKERAFKKGVGSCFSRVILEPDRSHVLSGLLSEHCNVSSVDSQRALARLDGEGHSETYFGLWFLTVLYAKTFTFGKEVDKIWFGPGKDVESELGTKRVDKSVGEARSEITKHEDKPRELVNSDGSEVEGESTWSLQLYLPPEASVTNAGGYENSGSRLRYDRRATDVFGRETEERELREFADRKAGFRWIQIAGVAGQGKSRLALELARERRSQDWDAGFLLSERLEEFVARVDDWTPATPTLILIDYVYGFEDKIGLILRSLAGRGQGKFDHAVRIVLIERQRWDRGGVAERTTSADGELEFTLAAGHAQWFETLNRPPGGGASGFQVDITPFAAKVVELTKLSIEHLVALVQAYSKNTSLSPDTIRERLNKIDPAGRPLFAMLFAEALSDPLTPDETAWSREELLDHILRRERARRWALRFEGDPPRGDEDIPAVQGALLATLTRGLKKRTLRKKFGDAFSNELLEQILVLQDAPVSADAAVVPPLEPDLLGGWMLLRAVKGGFEIEPVLRWAWEIDAVNTGATLRRLGEDFSGDEDVISLFEIEPENEEARNAYLEAAVHILAKAWSQERKYTEIQIKLLEAAADNEIGQAYNTLGIIHHHGCGIDSDPARAVEYFQRGAELGYGAARNNFGLLLMNGTQIEKDLDRAQTLFQAGVDEDSDRARTLLARLLIEHRMSESSQREGMRLLEVAAKRGYEDAICRYAFNLQEGIGVDAPDPEGAMKWYRKAAEAGNAWAMFSYALKLEIGYGADKPDPRGAMEFYRRAADNGDPKAMNNYAINLQVGHGVDEPNPRGAMDWLRKAAEAGDSGAMTNYADNLKSGCGVEKPDPQAAREWYRKANEAYKREEK